MQAYRDFAPTCFDSSGAFLPDRQDWLVAPVSINRDTVDPLTLSNWEAFQEALPGPEGGAWEIHRFGHWGPGWFEIILIRPNSDAVGVAQKLEAALETVELLSVHVIEGNVPLPAERALADTVALSRGHWLQWDEEGDYTGLDGHCIRCSLELTISSGIVPAIPEGCNGH